jgi:hypothetical protein
MRKIKSVRLVQAGYLAHMGQMTKVYRILDGKREGKIPLGKRRPR